MFDCFWSLVVWKRWCIYCIYVWINTPQRSQQIRVVHGSCNKGFVRNPPAPTPMLMSKIQQCNRVHCVPSKFPEFPLSRKMDVDSCCHCNAASIQKNGEKRKLQSTWDKPTAKSDFGVETKIPWSKFHSWLEEPRGKWHFHRRMNTSCTARTHWIFLILVVSVMSELLAAPPRAIATLAAPWYALIVWAASTWMCLTCLTSMRSWLRRLKPRCIPNVLSDGYVSSSFWLLLEA